MDIIKDLIALIEKYPLVIVTPETNVVLDTPDKIRAEADRDRVDKIEFSYRVVDGENIKEPNPHFGKGIEKLHSTAFRNYLLDMADKGEPVTLTTPQKVSPNRGNIRTVEDIIRRNWKLRDIILAADFLRGGTFISTTEPSAGSLLRKIAKGENVAIGWTCSQAGIVTETLEEDRELTRLWSGLIHSCYLYIGAASVLNMYDSRLFAGYAFADEGDGPTVYDLTLDELIKKTPQGLRDRIEKDLAPLKKRSSKQNGKINEQAAEVKRLKGEINELHRQLQARENSRNTQHE